MRLKYFESDRHPTWLELFYDLIYAAAIAKTIDILSENIVNYNYKNYLLIYFLTFIPIWWCWIGHTLVLNRFDVDDNIQKLMTFAKMLMILILVSVIGNTSNRGYIIFISTYSAIRIMIMLGYFRLRDNFPEYSQLAARMGNRFLIGIFFSILSLAFSGWARYSIFYLGIISDIFFTFTNIKFLGNYPIHKEHLVERLGLFTLVLLGDAMGEIALNLYNFSHYGEWLAGVLGFIMLCSIWWIYSESILGAIKRKDIKSGFSLIYGHLPIYLSLGMIAAFIKASVERKMIWTNYSIITVVGFALFFIGKQLLRTVYPSGIKKCLLKIFIGGIFLFVPLIWLLKSTREYVVIISILTGIFVAAAVFITYREGHHKSD